MAEERERETKQKERRKEKSAFVPRSCKVMKGEGT